MKCGYNWFSRLLERPIVWTPDGLNQERKREKMMKIPISGGQWEVKTKSDLYGGAFTSGTQEIVVGIGVPKMVPTIFLHEILEAILTERGHRFTTNPEEGNGGMLFSFNHREFDNVTRDLALALEGFLYLDDLIISEIEEEKKKVRLRTNKREKQG